MSQLIKAVLVGPSQSGKSSILNRLIGNGFFEGYIATIGADFATKDTSIGNTIQIWDTAGQERFQSISLSFYRGASLFCFVYDLGDADSVRELSDMVDTAVGQVDVNTCAAIFIGNKSDGNWAVTESSLRPMMDKFTRVASCTVSAKTNQGIDELGDLMANMGAEALGTTSISNTQNTLLDGNTFTDTQFYENERHETKSGTVLGLFLVNPILGAIVFLENNW
eukprot:TRINITY_DN11173_c0_g1_i1.p1 TRINITY_DN11173_c0_g1~~TRINITY_DN11173_c0_g1_i1.p1  ORF type:complete len:223 (+),score=39.43 TRINITY_DN11173_c0_g1_i1:77-745(+)